MKKLLTPLDSTCASAKLKLLEMTNYRSMRNLVLAAVMGSRRTSIWVQAGAVISISALRETGSVEIPRRYFAAFIQPDQFG